MKNLCILPFMQLVFSARKQFTPCCLIDTHLIKPSPLDLALNFNSSLMRNMRLDFLKGKIPDICTFCFYNNRSYIKYFKMKYYSKVDFLKIDKEGYSKLDNLMIVDTTPSNICNIDCIMCGYGINKKYFKQFPFWEPYQAIKLTKNEISNLMSELELLSNLDIIYLVGGETLLENNFFTMVDLLTNNPNIKLNGIQVITNCTIFNSKVEEALLKLANKVHLFLGMSIDGIGNRYNYIRKKADFNIVEKNIRLFLELDTQNISYFIYSAIGIYNAFHVLDLHKFLIEHLIKKFPNRHIQIIFNGIIRPEMFSLYHLPFNIKQDIIKLYREVDLDFPKNFNLKEQYKEEIYKIEISESKDGLLDKFVSFIKEIDQLYGDSFLTTFPEFKKYNLF